MPGQLTSVLFLGERSPYGLSVARCLLRSGLGVRRVVTPTQGAWDRIAARARRRSGSAWAAPLAWAARAARRALAPSPAAPPPGGEPIDPIRLDAGATAAQLRAACESSGIAWQEVDHIRSDALRSDLAALQAGLFFSAAFPLIFDEPLLALARHASINFHPSLLPRCRGSHPIYWTLAQGEPRGGVTAHLMTNHVDAGDIIMQVALPLTVRDDYARLYHRCMEVSSALVDGVERWVASGARGGKAQDEANATRFREDTEEDHRINWARSGASRVVALARAGEAFTTWRGERLGILRARVHDDAGAGARQPGEVCGAAGSALLVACAGSIAAIESMACRGMRYDAASLGPEIGLGDGAQLDSPAVAEAAR